VTLLSNVPRGKEETEALPKIFRWQKNGLEGLPILFLVAKKHRPGVTIGAGSCYPSGAHEFTPDFSGVRVAQ